MVFLTASKQITRLIGSPLLRLGLAARNSMLSVPLGGGGSSSSSSFSPSIMILEQKQPDAPYLDMALLIPFAQKLLSLALYDESKKLISKYYSEQQKDTSLLESLSREQRQRKDGDELSTTTIQALSDLRVQAYDKVIRKSLLPQESYSNLQSWMGHMRILKWARAEFLISKYGPMVKEAMDAYPQLRASPQFQRNPNHNFVLQLARGRLVLPSLSSSQSTSNDYSNSNSNNNRTTTATTMLPTTETIVKAFDLKDWAMEKNSQGLHESTTLVLDQLSSSLATNVDSSDDDNQAKNATSSVNRLSTEALLHVLTNGHVQHCGPLNAICEEANLYQLWTKEYVQHLGDYLLQEYSSATITAKNDNNNNNNNNKNTTTILDIGAGDGLLIRYLQEYMEGKLKKINRRKPNKNGVKSMPKMISTDDGSWGIFAKAKVEKLNVEAALEKYCARKQEEEGEEVDERLVVLCSWMPQQVDWTAQFRQFQVDEYILIGEADDGSCGHGWDTWGNSSHAPLDDSKAPPPPPRPPPFEQDGYQRWDMDSLVPFQFSRFDTALSKSSKTVSFRRSTKRQNR